MPVQLRRAGSTVDRTRCIVECVGMDERRPGGPPVPTNRDRGLVLMRAVTNRLEMRRPNRQETAPRCRRGLSGMFVRLALEITRCRNEPASQEQ
jgi:hypothetical protein